MNGSIRTALAPAAFLLAGQGVRSALALTCGAAADAWFASASDVTGIGGTFSDATLGSVDAGGGVDCGAAVFTTANQALKPVEGGVALMPVRSPMPASSKPQTKRRPCSGTVA